MAVQPCLCRTWSETPKTGFLTTRLKLSLNYPQISSLSCLQHIFAKLIESCPEKTSFIKITWLCNNDNIQMKNCYCFLIFVQNIECWYSLEPPRHGVSKENRQSMFKKNSDISTLISLLPRRYMSRVMRKPTFCICENKDADQLRSNCTADQRLCFPYTDSTIPLLSKSEISSL